MLSSMTPKSARTADAQHTAPPTRPILSRKVWLPKFFYDSIPYFYLMAGVVAFITTIYISDWFWILPHYLLFSVACLHIGIYVLRRRHRESREIAEPRQRPSGTSSNPT